MSAASNRIYRTAEDLKTELAASCQQCDALIRALELYEAAFTSLMVCSHPLKSAAGQAVDLQPLNAAHAAALLALKGDLE